MDIKKSEIQKMAEEYAEEQNSAYTNDYYGFIAGFEKALSLFAVSGRIEQFKCSCGENSWEYNKFHDSRRCMSCGLVQTNI